MMILSLLFSCRLLRHDNPSNNSHTIILVVFFDDDIVIDRFRGFFRRASSRDPFHLVIAIATRRLASISINQHGHRRCEGIHFSGRCRDRTSRIIIGQCCRWDRRNEDRRTRIFGSRRRTAIRKFHQLNTTQLTATITVMTTNLKRKNGVIWRTRSSFEHNLLHRWTRRMKEKETRPKTTPDATSDRSSRETYL